MDFEIDDAYLTDVVDYRSWSMYDDIPRDQLTNDQLINILKGLDRCSSTGTLDHPKFAELRNLLEEQGYIRCERGWWNGDRVLQPFRLNGKLFDTGEQYPCAAAMKIRLKYK
jgi:methylase of polypeptide subunit release factors